MSKRVLVTGADGFIGSHLVERLVHRGYQVRALAQYNSFNSWGWLEQTGVLDDIEVLSGDIRDPNFCRVLARDCDIVFHLAALIAIPYSYTAPDSYIDTNVKGTLNICQACLQNDVGRLVQTSTSEVYGTARYVPIDEQHPLQPQSPYSASKIGADALAMSFYHAFQLPVTTARPFNTYGPRQSARAVIPTIISQIAAGEPSIKLGDLTPTRDFNFVLDTCDGLISIAEAEGTMGEVINIGSNYEISIGDTLQLIKSMMNSEIEVIQEQQRQRPATSEVGRLWCDNSKLVDLTGFRPGYSLEEGLRETIDWFTHPDNLRLYKTHLYNQ